MILYVNGDSHTAAAEAVNIYSFASNDSKYFYMGAVPHPDNLAVSWGQVLSEILKTTFHCYAQSGYSNSKIIQTTREFLTKFEHEKPECLMIIQWSTWKNYNEQLDNKNCDRTTNVIDVDGNEYEKVISNADQEVLTQTHGKIWELHEELNQHSIPHIFFNGNDDFSEVIDQKDWGNSYIGPYDKDKTYNAILKAAGFKTVSPESRHFGSDAHRYWAKYMLQYIITNKFIK